LLDVQSFLEIIRTIKWKNMDTEKGQSISTSVLQGWTTKDYSLAKDGSILKAAPVLAAF
jgi:hypothetical protein